MLSRGRAQRVPTVAVGHEATAADVRHPQVAAVVVGVEQPDAAGMALGLVDQRLDERAKEAAISGSRTSSWSASCTASLWIARHALGASRSSRRAVERRGRARAIAERRVRSLRDARPAAADSAAWPTWLSIIQRSAASASSPMGRSADRLGRSRPPPNGRRRRAAFGGPRIGHSPIVAAPSAWHSAGHVYASFPAIRPSSTLAAALRSPLRFWPRIARRWPRAPARSPGGRPPPPR